MAKEPVEAKTETSLAQMKKALADVQAEHSKLCERVQELANEQCRLYRAIEAAESEDG